MLKIAQFTLTLLATCTIIGCGGGTSSSTSASALPSYPTTAKYLGTWNAICDSEGDIKANGFPGSYTVTSLELTGNTATTVTGKNKLKVYGYNDSNCSGALLGTMERSMTVTIDSAASGPSGSDKVGVVIQNSAISGNSVTLTSGSNSVIYTSGRTLGQSYKDIALATATTIKTSDPFTDPSSLNNVSYPTALDTTGYAVYTKQ
jgi:hypothetical protein